MSELTPELEAEIRRAINPAYARQKGTESFERRVLLAEIDNLRSFARAVMESWPDGDVDGVELQEIALRHGVLEQRMVQEPCGEQCVCAVLRIEFPGVCNFRVWWMQDK